MNKVCSSVLRFESVCAFVQVEESMDMYLLLLLLL